MGEYIEHLKSLSDERDSLMEKLEMENDHLKSDLEHVHADVSGWLRIIIIIIVII